MKILVLCDEGVKRSTVLAHQLRYLGHDVLTASLKRNKYETLALLCGWADTVILTSDEQLASVDKFLGRDEIKVWDIGPDVYPEKFNPQLLAKVKQLIKDHPL